MGASEGVYQTEREYAKDANDLVKEFGARYHPFRLATVLWERAQTDPVDIFLELVDGDRVYKIDEVLGCNFKNYAWPNSASPSLIYVVPNSRIRFRVTGAQAGEDQSVIITWAELGAI